MTKSLRKSIGISVAGLLLILSVLAPGLTAAETGTLDVRGFVRSIFEIRVIPNPEVGAFNLTVYEDGLLVGTVQERANVRSGYQVTISSLNASTISGISSPVLLGESQGNSSYLPYQIYYGDDLVEFDESGTAIVSDITEEQTPGGTTKSVVIAYDGSGETGENLPTDFYSDTLTFSIIPR